MTLGKFIDAQAEGLVGDGGDDDTVALQALIDGTRETTLYLPPGEYSLAGPLKMRSGLTLRGEAGRTRLISTQEDGTPAAPKRMIEIEEGVRGVALRDLVFEDIGGGFTAGVFLSPGEDGIQDITIQDCEFGDLTGYALRASGPGVKGLNFLNNYVHHLFTTGANFSGMKDSRCVGNRFAYCGDVDGEWAIYASGSLENCIISGNVVSGCRGGIKVVEHGTEYHNGVVIDGNVIEGCPLEGIVIGNANRVRCTGNIIRAASSRPACIMLEGGIIGFILSGNIIDLNGQDPCGGIRIANNGSDRGVVSGNLIYDGTGLQVARTGIAVCDATRLTLIGNSVHDCTSYGIDIGNTGSEVRDIQVLGNQVMEGCIRVKQGAKLVHIDGNFTRGATGSSRGVIVDAPSEDVVVDGNYHSNLGRAGSVNGGTNVLVDGNHSSGSPFQTGGQSAYSWRTIRDNPRPRSLLCESLPNSQTPEVGECGREAFIWPAGNGASPIMNFLGGYVGQTMRLLSKRQVTLQNSPSLVLLGGVDKIMSAGQTVTFCQFESGIWTEV